MIIEIQFEQEVYLYRGQISLQTRDLYNFVKHVFFSKQRILSLVEIQFNYNYTSAFALYLSIRCF